MRKGRNQKIVARIRGVLHQYVSGGEKWGNRLVINPKNLNYFSPYQHYQTEILHFLKFVLQENNFVWMIEMFTEISQIFIVRKSLKISLLAFWTRTSSKDFYETFKILKIPIVIPRRMNLRFVFVMNICTIFC